MFKQSIINTVLAAILISYIPGSIAKAKETCTCAGCKTEFYLIEHVLKEYHKKSEITYKPAKTGNKKAIELLAEGKINFAFTCKSHWKLGKKFKLDPEMLKNWESITIAKDPIVVVANPNCGADNLSKQQLCDIFSGKIKNWKDVGGADSEIKVGYLDDSVESGVVTVFKETTIGMDAKLCPEATQLKAPSNLGNFCKVTEGAIVFMGMNSYKSEYGKLLKIDSVEPSIDNIVANKYALAVTYHIVLAKNDDKAARSLLEYMASPEGKKKIDEVMIAIKQKVVKNN